MAAVLAVALLVGGCAGDDALRTASPAPPAAAAPMAEPAPSVPACIDKVTYTEQGKASWYGAEHQGRLTASGARFDMNRLTAAHRRLPFGTRLAVTNLSNGRTITVVVNDRGPYVRHRIIDLSRKAADELGFRRQGITTVRIAALARDCG